MPIKHILHLHCPEQRSNQAGSENTVWVNHECVRPVKNSFAKTDTSVLIYFPQPCLKATLLHVPEDISDM